jgi:hypothetical protein
MQRCREFRVGGPARLLEYGETALEEHLRVGISTLGLIQVRKMVGRHSSQLVIGPERLLADGEGPLDQRFGLLIASLILYSRGKRACQFGDFAMARSKPLLSEDERALAASRPRRGAFVADKAAHSPNWQGRRSRPRPPWRQSAQALDGRQPWRLRGRAYCRRSE